MHPCARVPRLRPGFPPSSCAVRSGVRSAAAAGCLRPGCGTSLRFHRRSARTCRYRSRARSGGRELARCDGWSGYGSRCCGYSRPPHDRYQRVQECRLARDEESDEGRYQTRVAVRTPIERLHDLIDLACGFRDRESAFPGDHRNPWSARDQGALRRARDRTWRGRPLCRRRVSEKRNRQMGKSSASRVQRSTSDRMTVTGERTVLIRMMQTEFPAKGS